jgi:hypothetical protein
VLLPPVLLPPVLLFPPAPPPPVLPNPLPFAGMVQQNEPSGMPLIILKVPKFFAGKISLPPRKAPIIGIDFGMMKG